MGKWSVRAPRISKASAVFGDPGTIAEAERGHDLESHLVELRTLDQLRCESAYLRDQGRAALRPLLEELPASQQDAFGDELMALRVLLESAPDKARQRALDHERVTVLQGKVSLDTLSANQQSVMTAAQALRLLAAYPSLAMSKGAMLCWYWIMREIYTASPPDRSVGGARASHHDGGWVSAYVTSLCMSAIDALADALDKTAQYFEEYGKAAAREQELSHNLLLPAAWVDVERMRLSRARQFALGFLGERAAAELPVPPAFGSAEEKDFGARVEKRAIEVLATLAEELTRAKTHIEEHWLQHGAGPAAAATREGAPSAAERHRVIVAAGHEIALAAIEKGLQRAVRARDEHRGDWVELAGRFASTAHAVREGLDVRPYLSSVIDAQLAHGHAANPQQVDLRELAFAARAYFCGTQPIGTEVQRMMRAVRCLSDKLAPDGTVPGRPFHAVVNPDQGPINFVVPSAEVVAVIAELMRFARFPVTPLIASKLFPNLLECRVFARGNPSQLLGWRRERARPGRTTKASLEPTAVAVMAFGAINDLLDDGINDVVLDHFSVTERKPGDVELDDLFYPDYGLHVQSQRESVARAGAAVSTRKKRRPETAARPLPDFGRHSIALTLQDMRSHVSRFGSAGLHSLVLFGPAGTGKTTLVEALAHSCEVPKVEVTPSDIAKAGEAAIEQRARAVFEALALLTRAVIIFDEFDPVLKRRDFTGGSPASFFSFLTPGMLPKLKNLSDSAKKRSVAYVLVTNLIGTLDEAAVRKGRFDRAVGIFPPDPLSRLGQLTLFCDRVRRKAEVAAPSASAIEPGRERLIDVVAGTGGAGMTILGAKGWFLRGTLAEARPGTPLSYIFGHSKRAQISWPDPEEKFDKVKGVGLMAAMEYRQWGWIVEWDKHIAAATPQGRERALIKWFDHCQESVERLFGQCRNEEDDQVVGLLGDEILLRWSGKSDNALHHRISSRLAAARANAASIRLQLAEPLLQPTDLQVLTRYAEEALRRPLIKDTAAVSLIIHVAGLSQDICNRQATLQRLGADATPAGDAALAAEWGRIEQVVERLDEAMTRLFAWLWGDYQKYLARHEARWSKGADDDAGTRACMEEARTRRRALLR